MLAELPNTNNKTNLWILVYVHVFDAFVQFVYMCMYMHVFKMHRHVRDIHHIEIRIQACVHIPLHSYNACKAIIYT